MQKSHETTAVNRIVTAWFEELDEQSDETIVAYVTGMLEDPEFLEWDDLDELVSGASAAFSSMNSATRQCKLLDMVQQVGTCTIWKGAGLHKMVETVSAQPLASTPITTRFEFSKPSARLCDRKQ